MKQFIDKYIFPKAVDKKLIGLWIPIYVQLAMLFVLTLSNNILVGHYGIETLAALGIGGNYLNAIMGVFFFLSLISTTAVAFFKGAKDHAKNTMTQIDCMIFAVLIGIIVTIAFELLTPSFIKLFPTDEEVQSLAILYSRVFIIALPFIFFSWSCIGILKGLQKAKLLMKISGGFLTLEILLNIFFVFICRLGIMGVALGPIIANILQSGVCIYFITRDFDKDAVKHYKPHILRLVGYIKDSIPLMIRSLAFWVLILLSLWCFSKLGTEYIAAGQIGDVVLSFAMFTFDALASASQSLVGEARGKNDFKLLHEIVERTKRIKNIFIPIVAIFYVAAGYFLPPIMTNDKTVSYLAFMMCLLSILAIPITSYTYTLDGVFLGFAKYNFLMYSAAISLAVCAAEMLIIVHTIQNTFILFTVLYLSYELIFVSVRGLMQHFEYKKIIKLNNI
ncbi:MAG: MATE family efflux transporter [Bifidobacteriaceae bacterium]|jgi:putative MATE family efflux protein|nr:MATE family efflux transporter [Bifidobacteriaceae bacterium]